MGIEIEKKYRLTEEMRERLIRRLRDVSASRKGEEFEENTLYCGGILNSRNCALRLRRVNGRAVLTYKERYPSSSAIKHQREEETRVEDADRMAAILDALGFKPALVYEKRRETWSVGSCELVIDNLPFGLFVEIEGSEEDIARVESLLDLEEAEPETATYPQLTKTFGNISEGIVEARFDKQ